MKLCRVQKVSTANKATLGHNPFQAGQAGAIPYITTHDGTLPTRRATAQRSSAPGVTDTSVHWVLTLCSVVLCLQAAPSATRTR